MPDPQDPDREFGWRYEGVPEDEREVEVYEPEAGVTDAGRTYGYFDDGWTILTNSGWQEVEGVTAWRCLEPFIPEPQDAPQERT